MVALPGFVAAALVVNELLWSLRRLRIDGASPAVGPAVLGRWRRLADPTRRWWLSAVFLGLPWACLAAVAASFVTHGGPLYTPSRSGMLAYVCWCLWACFATPGAVRIPLWSAVPWAALLFTQLADDPVAEVFMVAVIALLFVSVVLVLWRHDRADR